MAGTIKNYLLNNNKYFQDILHSKSWLHVYINRYTLNIFYEKLIFLTKDTRTLSFLMELNQILLDIIHIYHIISILYYY